MCKGVRGFRNTKVHPGMGSIVTLHLGMAQFQNGADGLSSLASALCCAGDNLGNLCGTRPMTTRLRNVVESQSLPSRSRGTFEEDAD